MSGSDTASLPERDVDGYLIDPKAWLPDIAATLAALEGVTLREDHYIVLHAMRDFYQRYDHAPNNRAMISYLGKTLGKDWGNSSRIMLLFGGTAAKTAAKWAGLPKPAHCL